MFDSIVFADIDEIARQVAWEEDLAEDLKSTRAKRAHLTRAVVDLMGDMAEDARRTADLRLAAALAPVDMGPRKGGPSSDKVQAVMDYCARSPGVVTTCEIQRFLEKHGLADYPNAASTMLSRKMKQGIFQRVGRGRYRMMIPGPST